MAAKYLKHASYREHTAALRPLLSDSGLPTKLIFVYGTAELLLAESVRLLRAKAKTSGAVITAIEASTINEVVLSSLTQQGSLFEATTFYVIRRTEAAKHIAKMLALIPKHGSLSNYLCLVYQGEAPPAALKTILTQHKAHFLPCFTPWPNEVPQVLCGMAEHLGLRLSSDAAQLLIDANGDDLAKTHNELRRLLCIFGASDKLLAATDLAPYLDVLREEDALQLHRLLLQKHWAKAHALAVHLLARGERGLPLVAILAGHCRTVLKLTAALSRGVLPQGLAAAARIPPFTVKTYLPYLNRATNLKLYEDALGLCQEADALLKSTRFSEDLLIARIIDALTTA